jgi:hypothetical protein
MAFVTAQRRLDDGGARATSSKVGCRCPRIAGTPAVQALNNFISDTIGQGKSYKGRLPLPTEAGGVTQDMRITGPDDFPDLILGQFERPGGPCVTAGRRAMGG